MNFRNSEQIFNQSFIHKQYKRDFLSIINENNMNNRFENISKIYERMESKIKTMNIFVKYLNGKSKIFKVKPDDTIDAVKNKIEIEEGFPPVRQRLIFSGVQLDDTKTLADYNIQNESVIHLVIRPR